VRGPITFVQIGQDEFYGVSYGAACVAHDLSFS
jgi:hypothetical protein